MADIDELLATLDLEAWRTFELNTAEELGFVTTAWRDETPERVLIEIDSRGLVLLGGVSHEAIRGGFLTYARGAWLTMLASDTFETERKLATYASCLVTFTGSNGTPYSVPANDRLIIKKTGTDITYAVAGPFTIPGNASVAGLTAVCETAGSAGNAAPAGIEELQDALPGVGVTNTTVAVGLDEETDAALEARSRLATGPLSPAGPPAAYEYVATTTLRLDGQPVDVVKVLVKEDEDDGSVTAYYASASGASVDVGTTVAPAPGTVNYEIRRLVRPNGVKYVGLSAIPLVENFSYTALVRSKIMRASGLTLADIEERIADYLTTYIASPDMPIEGYPLFVPVPPYVGSMPAQDIADLIGEAVRIGSDIEAGNPGQKVVYGVVVLSGTVLFSEGEVLVPGTINGSLVEMA